MKNNYKKGGIVNFLFSPQNQKLYCLTKDRHSKAKMYLSLMEEGWYKIVTEFEKNNIEKDRKASKQRKKDLGLDK